MSNNAEFDRLVDWIMENSQVKGDMAQQEWETWMERRLRMIFRVGAQAQLSHEFDGLRDDALARLDWLSARGFFAGADIKALLNEVEGYREQKTALRSTYGVTDEDLRSMMSEGFHTAFRKAVDHPYATVIHKLIRDMPGEDWTAILDFVTRPIIRHLREAQRAAERAEKEKSE